VRVGKTWNNGICKNSREEGMELMEIVALRWENMLILRR
jgi:hypothetical protein